MSALVAAVCLVVATSAVHVSGLHLLNRRLNQVGAQDLTGRGARFFLQMVLLVTLAIVMLHMLEIWIWATFYRTAVGIEDWSTAVHLSLGYYSTAGAELALPREWRVLGGVEAMLGALMFGLSTAYLFAVVSEIHRRSPSAKAGEGSGTPSAVPRSWSE